MIDIVFFKEWSIIFVLMLADVFTFVFIGGLILMVCYGHKREALYKKLRLEKAKIRKEVIPVQFQNNKIEALENYLQAEIQEIDRKRQEVMDFMPFIKK